VPGPWGVGGPWSVARTGGRGRTAGVPRTGGRGRTGGVPGPGAWADRGMCPDRGTPRRAARPVSRACTSHDVRLAGIVQGSRPRSAAEDERRARREPCGRSGRVPARVSCVSPRAAPCSASAGRSSCRLPGSGPALVFTRWLSFRFSAGAPPAPPRIPDTLRARARTVPAPHGSPSPPLIPGIVARARTVGTAGTSPSPWRGPGPCRHRRRIPGTVTAPVGSETR
jgi:hypothetical protein